MSSPFAEGGAGTRQTFIQTEHPLLGVVAKAVGLAQKAVHWPDAGRTAGPSARVNHRCWSLMPTSWNQIVSWIRQIAAVQTA